MHRILYLSIEFQDLIFSLHIKQVLKNYSESIFLLLLNNLKFEHVIFKSISLNIFIIIGISRYLNKLF